MKVIVSVFVNGSRENIVISDPSDIDDVQFEKYCNELRRSTSDMVITRGKTSYYFRKEILNNSVIAVTEVE
jgi:hypothetical protein